MRPARVRRRRRGVVLLRADRRGHDALRLIVERDLLREARVASQLASDHLVQVVDFGVDRASGLLFLVMPIVQGGDLEALLGQVGALPPVVAVRIAMQADQEAGGGA